MSENAIPGGAKMPAAKLGPDGKFDRADLRAGVDAEEGSGTSIFDPVLCELAYRWFCPKQGLVLDPFAGGSVRGILAGWLGRRYLGIDLRAEQLAANRDQLTTIISDPEAQQRVAWMEGDSRDVLAKLIKQSTIAADFLFSCPPYGDLEVYSDDPKDLSTMDFAEFSKAYRQIILQACDLLKGDRFACFVVGDFRDERGRYRNFPGLTIRCFEEAGLALYNEAILVTAADSLPIRARKMFESTRKLGKTHQQLLVFLKGDPRKATEAIGEVEFGEPANIEDVAAAAASSAAGM